MIDRIPLRAHYVTNSNHCMPRPTNQSNLVFGQTKPIQYWITDGAKWCCSRPPPVFTVSEPIKHEHKYVYTGKKKLRNKIRKYFSQKCVYNADCRVRLDQIGCGGAHKDAAWLKLGCGVAQRLARWLAVWRAWVQFPPGTPPLSQLE
jgi:hypothetical protein